MLLFVVVVVYLFHRQSSVHCWVYLMVYLFSNNVYIPKFGRYLCYFFVIHNWS